MAITVSKERLNVTEMDFDQIKSNLKTFLESQTQLADYDYEGSAISTIIDVLAYNTFYNAFNANLNINEIFLDTAQVRNNVVSHARSLGYVPRSTTSAFATVNVTVNNPSGSPSSLAMARGTTFQTKIDNKEMDDALRAQFNKMINLGYKNIYYLETPKITDTDNEGTVDGVHFTDLGFKRYADFLLKEFTELSLID